MIETKTNIRKLLWEYVKCTIIFFVLFFLSISAKSAGQKPIRLQLKWRNQFQFAGYYAAQIKGFYKEEGLNVKIIPGGPGISPINRIQNGFADIGVFDPNILMHRTKEKPLVVLAAIMQSSGYCILSLKSKKILRPSDLIGKTILADNDQGWDIFRAILLKEGLKSDSVKVLSRLKDSEEIIQNKADAVVTYITTQPQRLNALGYEVNIIRPVEYGVDFYGDVLFSTREFAYANSDKTDAFIRATLKGWKYALAHEDELINYILTMPDVKAHGNSRNNLKVEAKEVKKLIMPELIEIGHMNLGRWQYMLNLYQQLGIASKNITLKDFLYSPKEFLISNWIKPAVYGALLIILIIVIVIVLNWQLRTRVRVKTEELRKEIEQRRTAQESANEREEQLELILKSAKIGLWEWDLKSNKKSFNDEFAEILNYKRSNLPTDYDFFNNVHPDDVASMEVLFNIPFVENSVTEMTQFRIANANNEYINVLSSSKLMVKNNEAFKLCGVILDINDIKKKEYELLEVSEELMRSNNELKKFAYITSHNLRAPVVNLTSLYEMINLNKVESENKIYLEKIGISIRKLENTLNDLIEVVSHQKPEKKKLSHINFSNAFQSIFHSIENQIVSSGVHFTFDFEVEAIIYSHHYLESILLNLVTNSIKYRSKERKLEIAVRTYESENYIVLRMSDNGIGIDLSKNSAKIFGLYQRFTPEIEGKGIGLFIIKSHIESLNGKIEVDSEPNVGTTFSIYFSKEYK